MYDVTECEVKRTQYSPSHPYCYQEAQSRPGEPNPIGYLLEIGMYV